MPDDPRVQELLDELLERDATPEEVCTTCPDLLPIVNDRWKQICRARAEFDALFPQWPKWNSSTPPSQEPAIPQIPGYRIEGVLGHGGMGVVFRARHLKLDRLVALKMTLSGAYSSPHERERFRREAEAVAALKHGNIVQIYDVGDWDGRPYFTMELIDGDSLGQRLAGAPLPVMQSATLLVTLAKAVHAAHQAGIVHRDLKPGNVLFTAEGTPKITDFGLARRLDATAGLTMSGVLLGTPSYMAPEQVRGQSHVVGPAADVYALGSILYELLTGSPPFRGESPTETLLQVVEQEPVSPTRLNSRVPRDLETICFKCLEKEPQRRYSTADALADDLNRFAELRPIRARPHSWAARMWRWIQRNPASAGLIATMSILVILATSGGLWLDRERAERRAADTRQSLAIEAALEQSSALGRRGRWPEAVAVLDGAPTQLGNSAPTELRQRLAQARADADMAVALDSLRSRLSTDPLRAHDSAAPLYREAFRDFGIDVAALDAMEAEKRICQSAIRDTLVAYLHDWHYWARDAEQVKLQEILDRIDDDPWRSDFRETVASRHSESEQSTRRMKELAASPDASLQSPLVLSGLGGVVLFDGLREEALTLLQHAQQRYPDDFWLNYLLGLYWENENPQAAVGYFRAAMAIRPESDETCAKLGRCLLETEEVDGAIAAFQNALALNPSGSAAKELARALAPQGRLEEARSAWEKVLKQHPPDHNAWYGYAPLCLFLGNEEAYQAARRGLLARFGATTGDWILAERVSLACLLGPGSDDELRRAVDLAGAALKAGANEPNNPYLLFLNGLMKYRLGQFSEAIPLLEDSAAQLPNRAGPRLVLAMAEHRSGAERDARESFASAVSAYNWRASHADHATAWVSHALRREAERLILPDSDSLLSGESLASENCDRLALFSLCEFEGIHLRGSLLAMDAFAADADLADELTRSCLTRAALESDRGNRGEVLDSDLRYRSACCAALVAEGRDNDSASLSRAERTQWRMRAVNWLTADLVVLSDAVENGQAVDADLAKQMLILWREEPAFAGIRDARCVQLLSADERKACIKLWDDVQGILARCGDAE